MGETFAIFSESGKIADLRELLKISQRGSHKLLATNFMTLIEMSS